ncbi:hypothetical protein L249_3604 [Ophiocordyceps polyrhachis-furcata BCC 54312]|uniref:Uncharacterized protein n=1 Tax=Ophiocordyceps polyrhachis-furcata BCC 54312 TaxID=1330021 RepID=A0A367LME3_9HYPO|nr:hypothetical protein L249_3604 [Ophiocordyceps polyrhachis-furcata BCC 54312]
MSGKKGGGRGSSLQRSSGTKGGKEGGGETVCQVKTARTKGKEEEEEEEEEEETAAWALSPLSLSPVS